MMRGSADRQLRVLLLIHDLKIGGTETGVCNLAGALARLGCAPVVCGWRRGGVLEARLREAAVPVELPTEEPLGWRRVRVPGFLQAVIARQRSDVIHAHLSDSAAWGVLMQGLAGRPCVVSHHSNDLIDGVGRNRGFYRWGRHQLLRQCIRRAAANVAISASVRAQLMAHAGPAIHDVSIVPRGVPLPPPADVELAVAQRRARAEAGFAAGAGPTILFVGRLDGLKGLDTLIAAAPAVLARFPGARFVLLGEGPSAASVSAHARALGIASQVQLPGAAAEVSPWLAGADVYVSASRLEGLSTALLEAMSWGLPVVVSAIPGHHEIVHHGETGMLFPADAPAALSAALISALGDWPASAAGAAGGLALVREHYGIDAMARRYLEIYQAAATRAAGQPGARVA